MVYAYTLIILVEFPMGKINKLKSVATI